MPKFSSSSAQKLAQRDLRLQAVFLVPGETYYLNIKYRDNARRGARLAWSNY